MLYRQNLVMTICCACELDDMPLTVGTFRYCLTNCQGFVLLGATLATLPKQVGGVYV